MNEFALCPDCGNNVFDPFTECRTCEETAQAINKAEAEKRPTFPLVVSTDGYPTLAERLAADMQHERYAR